MFSVERPSDTTDQSLGTGSQRKRSRGGKGNVLTRVWLHHTQNHAPCYRLTQSSPFLPTSWVEGARGEPVSRMCEGHRSAQDVDARKRRKWEARGRRGQSHTVLAGVCREVGAASSAASQQDPAPGGAWYLAIQDCLQGQVSRCAH